MSALARPRHHAGRVLRDAALYPAMLCRRGASLRVAFLPGDAKAQSSLLRRAFDIAGELKKQGWATLTVPRHLLLALRSRVRVGFRPGLVVVPRCRHPLNRAEYPRQWSFFPDVDAAGFLDPAPIRARADIAFADYARRLSTVEGGRDVSEPATGARPAPCGRFNMISEIRRQGGFRQTTSQSALAEQTSQGRG